MATRFFCVGLLFMLLCPVATQRASADGTEFTAQGDDLLMTVDSRWIGGMHGGYYPLRIFLENSGEARDLTVEFSSEHENIPTVTRSTHLEQNGREFFSLPIPLVGTDLNGALRVTHKGKEIRTLTSPVQIPSPAGVGDDRPSLLIISPQTVDGQWYEYAVNYFLSDGGTSSSHSGRGSSSRGSNHQWILPAMLPTRWLDYSGLDIVAIPLASLRTISEQNRSALLKWVHTGGTLLVYSVHDAPDEATEAIALTELDEHSSSGGGWRYAVVSDHDYIPLIESEQGGRPTILDIDGRGRFRPEWPTNKDTFASKKSMLGRVYFFMDNPFPGSHHDWNWFLQDLTREQAQWTTRHGMSARQGNAEFLNFLNPGVKGVPVYSFLVLISLFTFIIGPLNYYLLWKKKKLHLLLVTIPVLACVTSLCLFSYSIVSHGFTVKSRVRSVTVLDQESNTAVSMGRISLFAGFAPSDGLNFSPETAVYPVWSDQQSFESGITDWTEQQSLKRGWLRSRTRTQFLTVTHRPERGRLNINLTGSGSLNVENGLEWDIETILVRDENGTLYYGENLDSDDAISLKQASDDDMSKLLELSEENEPEMPETIVASPARGIFNLGAAARRRHYHYSFADPTQTQFSRGLLERGFGDLQTMIRQRSFRNNLVQQKQYLQNKSYVAILKDNPGITVGVKKSKPKGDSHLLLGFY